MGHCARVRDLLTTSSVSPKKVYIHPLQNHSLRDPFVAGIVKFSPFKPWRWWLAREWLGDSEIFKGSNLDRYMDATPCRGALKLTSPEIQGSELSVLIWSCRLRDMPPFSARAAHQDFDCRLYDCIHNPRPFSLQSRPSLETIEIMSYQNGYRVGGHPPLLGRPMLEFPRIEDSEFRAIMQVIGMVMFSISPLSHPS